MLQFLLQFEGLGVTGRCGFCTNLRFLFRRRCHIGKDNHDHSPKRLRLFDFLDGDIDGMRAVALANRETPDGDRPFLPQRLLESAAEIKTEPLTGHSKNIPVGLAGCGFQILARPSADIENIPFVIDQHGGGRKTLQEQLIGE